MNYFLLNLWCDEWIETSEVNLEKKVGCNLYLLLSVTFFYYSLNIGCSIYLMQVKWGIVFLNARSMVEARNIEMSVTDTTDKLQLSITWASQRDSECWRYGWIHSAHLFRTHPFFFSCFTSQYGFTFRIHGGSFLFGYNQARGSFMLFGLWG